MRRWRYVVPGEDDAEAAGDDEAIADRVLSTLDGIPAFNPYRDVSRNDPCPCGSGKKFKQCCLGKA